MSIPFNPFRIDWNACSSGQWDRMVAACRRPNLLQTWQYAAALARTEGWAADFGIIRFHDRPIGAVQVQVKRGLPILRPCRIYRGPIWIYDEIPGEMLKLVLRMLRQRYHLLKGRPLIFHPELPDGPETQARMKAAGFIRRTPGYASIWLDLDPSLDDLRKGLRPGWRNSLAQAEKRGTAVEIDREGRHLDEFLERYQADKAARSYTGPSPAFVRAYYAACGAHQAPLLLRARRGDEVVAGILVVRHGKAATYLVGWTTDAGREARAHHALLWRAVTLLKQEGYRWFDLGGINEAEAPGLRTFKEGLGGRPFTLAGGFV